eukprot:Plantae.Rhodophyta-Rhodochaete_pulchella.ctg485.p2 GENE.Plantae.Rhodophyta-Rhodochaete_pulchella.ctg485~~Plantae.Rhodophyta-Rhodochaete_pulchella.ctg485.p2  ORF type:complete len:155 (-),score=13.52 Plantae.Rhodophyta-Rhodochaete_pulchella.ctg485:78-542(-)
MLHTSITSKRRTLVRRGGSRVALSYANAVGQLSESARLVRANVALATGPIRTSLLAVAAPPCALGSLLARGIPVPLVLIEALFADYLETFPPGKVTANQMEPLRLPRAQVTIHGRHILRVMLLDLLRRGFARRLGPRGLGDNFRRLERSVRIMV